MLACMVEESVVPGLPKNVRRALLAWGLIPPEFGRRERVLTLVAVMLGSLALILIFATATMAGNFFIPLTVLGAAGFIVFGKQARGLLTAIFTGILSGGFFATVAVQNGGLHWFAEEVEFVIGIIMWFVVAPVMMACIVTSVGRREWGALLAAATLLGCASAYGWWFHFSVGPNRGLGAELGTVAGVLGIATLVLWGRNRH
jgi:hypothetical protein